MNQSEKTLHTQLGSERVAGPTGQTKKLVFCVFKLSKDNNVTEKENLHRWIWKLVN